MIRRFPIEQFPEKFTEIREAYQTLIDPTAEFRNILFDDSLDIGSLSAPYAPLNAKPQEESEIIIFQALSALLRENFSEIINRDFNDIGDEDLDHTLQSLLSGFDREGDLEAFLGDLMGRPRGKKR